jgi:hypothetical protein
MNREARVWVAKRLDCGDLLAMHRSSSPLSRFLATKRKAPMNRRTPKPGGLETFRISSEFNGF